MLQVGKLLAEGLTVVQTASRLQVSPAVVYTELRKIKDLGHQSTADDLSAQRLAAVASRRYLVAGLSRAGLPNSQIRELLGVTDRIVQRDIEKLRVAGVLAGNRRTLRKEERLERIASLRQENKTVPTIAAELDLREGMVDRDLQELAKRGVRFPSLFGKSALAAKRREQIPHLWDAGLNGAEMAERLSATPGQIASDLRVLRRAGRLARRKRPVGANRSRADRRTARQEQVATLWSDGQPVAGIAQSLGVSQTTIYKDVEVLRESGIDVTRPEAPRSTAAVRRAGRREKVAGLWKTDRTVKEIADWLGVHPETVLSDVRALRELGFDLPEKKVVPKRRETVVKVDRQKRRQMVESLWKKDHSAKQIATKLGVTTSTVYSDIRVLRESGVELASHRATAGRREDVTKRRQEVKALWRNLTPAGEIAASLGVTKGTVYSDVSTLRSQGEDLSRPRILDTGSPAIEVDGLGTNPEVRDRRTQVASLWERDKETKPRIAETLGVSERTIERDIDKLAKFGWIVKRPIGRPSNQWKAQHPARV